MSKFHIVWPDGTEEDAVHDDCSTVEEFINCRFGSSDSSKAKITLVEEEVKTEIKAKSKTAK
jgi:hypothetical protein